MPSPLPTTEDEALTWIQEALRERRYILDTHFLGRLSKRNLAFRSAWYAIKDATSCKPYVPARGPLAGGTSWRVTGPDHNGEEVSVGAEAFVDHLGRRVLLITIF